MVNKFHNHHSGGRNAWCNRPAHEMHLSYEEWLDRKVVTEAPAVVKVSGRARHITGRMNGLEKRYAAHLDLLKITGEILDWKFEPLKLKLAPATFYNPDFMVNMTNHGIEFHETKGTRNGKPYYEDDAIVKWKVAAKMFNEFLFALVWSDGNEWRMRYAGSVE